MPLLHYGPELRVRLDPSTTRQIMEAIDSHSSRGGWVTATDTEGHEYAFLVTGGIPIWISDIE